MIYEVIVDISNSQVDRVFDYRGEGYEIGCRVEVPFGSKRIEGFIVGQKSESDVDESKIKEIVRPLDDFCALSRELLELCGFMRKKYHLRQVDAMRLCIPAQMRNGRVKPLFKTEISLADGFDAQAAAASLKAGAFRQKQIIERLQKEKTVLSEILGREYGAAALNALKKKGIVASREVTVRRMPYRGLESESVAHILTEEQQNAVFRIESASGVYLLHGVTGSGKTEVYMRVIEDAVKNNKTAVMLVPEISLTPNVMRLFRNRFKDKVALLHSGLSAGERFDEWHRLKTGEAMIAVGARSAIFAPLKNIGVIIIDEEHDGSYFSESNPRYDTQEVAEFRRAYNDCALVLGSATPSLKTYYNASKGKINLIELKNRINNRPLPQVDIVDMAAEVRAGNKELFSRQLKEELQKTVEEGHQAILFLNRRGYSSFVMCSKCGYVAKCPNCDVSLTYHRDEDVLKCHYCGKMFRLFKTCPACKSAFIRQGRVGDQQVVEYIRSFLPDVKVLRMDADTTQGKDSHRKILEAFGRGEASVLVGTQMIAKGHDFPRVTLVGILEGDQSLYYSDYMAAEKTFQLLTQVAGRSGRDKSAGKVVLQTYNPRHYCLRLAASQDYVSFFKREIALREATGFPPFATVVRLLYSDENGEKCIELLNRHYSEIERLKNVYGEDFLFLQKMRCPVKRIDKKYRFQILMRLSAGKTDEIMQRIYEICDKNEKKVTVFAEVNPQNMS